MRSSWPILIGIAFIGLAAIWYDAKNEVAAAAAPATSAPAVVTAEAKLDH
jgi:hypothetical protein